MGKFSWVWKCSVAVRKMFLADVNQRELVKILHIRA
jgi:hypothetical protein